ncbi:aprataxin-like protein [Aricia agestis]|uniref:aprataxin-like protein n=1 Tax=Aricia agestis TaxID=91739 RepID=UPI001C201E70|nr:aprataxin-like protein [Aricia agestis]
MSKRNYKSNNESSSLAKQPKKHWSLGLLDTMKDPKYVYKDSERVVVIKDKYPKAKVHYLVLPREQISSIFSLNKTHLSLLEEFGTFVKDIRQEHKDADIVAGFHAVPSMHLMHMHVISKDMISDCLKTKTHWNSFTTKFFIPYEEILERIRNDGAVKRISDETHKQLLAMPLKCNQCEFVPKNLPILKQHLLTHNS